MTEKIRANFLGLISIALLLLGSSDALAELKTFTLALPTAYENGDPLPAAEIARTAVKCAGVDGGPYQERVSSPGGVTSLQSDFVDGSWYCVATVTAVNGSESGPSNQVFFQVLRRPSAPGLSVD